MFNFGDWVLNTIIGLFIAIACLSTGAAIYWRSLPVGSNIIYSFDIGRLGGHYNEQIELTN